jgi:hypothetical protein
MRSTTGFAILAYTEGRTMFLAVPEAAVHEDDWPVFRQHEAHAVEHRVQRHFRLGVPATDALHDFGAILQREDIRVERLKSWRRRT